MSESLVALDSRKIATRNSRAAFCVSKIAMVDIGLAIFVTVTATMATLMAYLARNYAISAPNLAIRSS